MNALTTFLTNAQTILNGASAVAITVACIYDGYLFFTAHDSMDRMSSAKTMFKNIVIGSLLIIGYNVIIGTFHTIAGA